MLDELKPRRDGRYYAEQITYVQDRPGHDVRYAIGMTKIKTELNWSPSVTFTEGITKTISWYLDAQEWLEQISETSSYQQERLGVQRQKKDNN